MRPRYRSGYGCELLRRVEIQLGIQNREIQKVRAVKQQSVPIGGRSRYRHGRRCSACARPIFDYDILTNSPLQDLTNRARHRIGRAAGWQRHDYSDGLAGIGLSHRERGTTTQDTDKQRAKCESIS
jgi:hypothetical protein